MQPININSQRSARSEIHAVAGGRRALRGEEVILFISPVAAHPTRQLFPLIGTV